MAEAIIHTVTLRELEKAERQLPQYLSDPWQKERNRRIVTLEEARTKSRAAQLHPTLKRRLSIRNLAPASALILIYFVNRFLQAGKQLSNQCLSFSDLIQRPMIVRMLDGPLNDLGGPTKILLLRSIKTFSERVLMQATEGLDVAILRIRANELARDYSSVLKDYSEYRTAALTLEPTMQPDEPHDLTSAIMAREKAIACMAVSIDPRLGEISGLASYHVVIDGDEVTVVIPAEISKERISQSRALDAECAKPFIEYVCRARPFLSERRPQGVPECDALWLTRNGGPLAKEGVDQALSKVLAGAMGAPVSTKIIRKAMASRSDLADAQIGAALGHTLHSLIGIDVYGARDLKKARHQLVSLWDRFESK